MIKGFKNVNAYIYGKGIINTNIGIENGKICYIGNKNDFIEEICKIDGILVPGFIDQHIHGAGNSDTMDSTFQSIQNISTTLAKEGTTSFIATTMTQSVDKIKNAITNLSKINNKDLLGAKLIGVHLEGTFLSKTFKGAHLDEFIINPDIETLDEIFKTVYNLNDFVKVITYAPEHDDDNYSFLNYLKSKNIIVGAGHSNASFDIINSSVKNGVSFITHTYNAQSKLHHREIGVVGSALLIDEVYTEIICDLIHSSIPAIKLLIKNKPKDKIILITDSIKAKGISGDKSELGGQEVFINNGKATLKDGTIAGSILKMNDAIKNLITKVGVSFENAVNFATYNPAKHLNILDKVGTIEIGKNANFTVLDKDYNISLTMVDGEIVYNNK